MFGIWWIFIGLIVMGLVLVLINLIKSFLDAKYRAKKWGDKWTDNFTFDIFDAPGIFSFAFWLIALIVFLPISIAVPCNAKQDVAYWKRFNNMATEIVVESDDYQSIGLAGKIIEYNMWLADAKASKETWGIWSEYVYEDLDELDYIKIKK